MQLYLSQQVYQLDRLAIEQDQQPAQQLMQRAAWSVWRNILQRWTQIQNMLVFAGPGNNGGDAFAVACLARDDGFTVSVIAVGELSRQSTESAHYRRQWEQGGGSIERWNGDMPGCDLIVDGLLGIGLNKPLDESWQELIAQINSATARRVSIDIPSGLAADRGIPLPLAVKADLTVSFIGRKLGCYLADAADFCGERVFDDLGLSRAAQKQVLPAVLALDADTLALPGRRRSNTFKNNYGHILVVGGGTCMSGAARLAGLAALRCGCGLVSLCVHPDNLAIAAADHAELMVSDWGSLPQQLHRATLIIIGPGLGHSEQASTVLEQLVSIDKPLVVDADALEAEFLTRLLSRTAVLTPHPGEAARLLGCTSQDVQQDRLASLQGLNTRWKYVSVLKGAGTLVGQSGETPSLCLHGHAGMATAGMGDVLAGIIGALMAQGLSAFQAARTGVLVHAMAAECATDTTSRSSLIASDVIAMLPSVIQSLLLDRENGKHAHLR